VATAAGATYVAAYAAGPAAEASVIDFQFSPRNLFLAQGDTARWSFVGPSDHTVTDSSGAALFDSGPRAPGSTFTHTFTAAGRYPLRCSIHTTMTGSVQVPMIVSPASGTIGTAFTLTWASAPPSPSHVFDVEIRRPNSSSFSNWVRGTRTTEGSFVPDGGTGTYEFRSRIRNAANTRGPSWSATIAIAVSAGNRPPAALIQATPTSGDVPLAVAYDGTGSSDPDPGDPLTYEWDLDGDGQFDDSVATQPGWTYNAAGDYTVSLRVTDAQGAQDIDSIVITATEPTPPPPANEPPIATIDSPAGGFTWRVGESISFTGHADDPEDGSLPPAALSWSVGVVHCPNSCHEHPVLDLAGAAGGMFEAPDHTYPSQIQIRLTATDTGGRQSTATLLLEPETVDVTLGSDPAGLALELNGVASTAPFTTPAIIGSTSTIRAPSPQTVGGTSYEFSAWSDGGAATHDVSTGETATTLTATFLPVTSVDVSVTDFQFTPRNVDAAQGQTVRWNFNGPSDHSVTDSSGMGLFDSGIRAPGSTYSFSFVGAGRYPFRCQLHPSMTGSVQVPVLVSPASGVASTVFTVTWGSAPAPAGYTFEVEVRRPGAASWVRWMVGTSPGAAFTPDGGPGTYEFRARLRNVTNNRAPAFSAPSAIQVS
jgi:plastocyanin